MTGKQQDLLQPKSRWCCKKSPYTVLQRLVICVISCIPSRVAKRYALQDLGCV